MRTLSFPRRTPRHALKKRFVGRRPAFEPLEKRELLAVDLAHAFSLGGPGNDNVRDIATDPNGNLCVVGKFVGTVDFDPSANTYELTSSPAGSRTSYVAKYDPNGALLC